MFRYLERSENNARLIDAGLRIALTRSETSAAEWQSILATSASREAYIMRHSTFQTAKVIDFLLRDTANPSSVLSVIKSARDNARLVRTALTREVWEATNVCWMTLQTMLARPVKESDLPEVLAAIRQQNAIVRGAMTGTMLRNDGYNFATLGTFLERADNTARILDVKYYLLLPSVAQIGSSLDNMQWETILRSVSAQRAYQWLNGADISPRKIAQFLILHRHMPRSLIFCCNKIAQSLGHIGHEYGSTSTSYDLANGLFNRLDLANIDQVFDAGLHEYILRFLADNNALGQQVQIDYRFRE